MSSTDLGSEQDDQRAASEESTENEPSEADTKPADSPSSPEKTASEESTVKQTDDTKRTKVNKAWFDVHREKQEAERLAKQLEGENQKLKRKEEVRKLIASNPNILIAYNENPDHPDTAIANELLDEGDLYAVRAFNSVFKNPIPMSTPTSKPSSPTDKSSNKDFVTKEDLKKMEKQREFNNALIEIRADYPELTSQVEGEIMLEHGGEKAIETLSLAAFKRSFKAAAEERFGAQRKSKEAKEKEIDDQQHSTVSTTEKPKASAKIPKEYRQAFSRTVEAFKALGDPPFTEQEWMEANGLI